MPLYFPSDKLNSEFITFILKYHPACMLVLNLIFKRETSVEKIQPQKLTLLPYSGYIVF